MLTNFFFFFSLPALLLEQYVVRPGTGPVKWWLTYAGIVLIGALFEQPGINADGWRYYGVQAFSVNTYPVWVVFANAAALFAIAMCTMITWIGYALLNRHDTAEVQAQGN